MPYQFNLLMLTICLLIIWPGAVTIYLFFAALGWLFISGCHGIINGK
jgi:hypothetical protein